MIAYAILLTRNNEFSAVANNEVADIIRKNNGYFVQGGYNPLEYIACFVFQKQEERDNTAIEFQKADIDFDTRDDAIVDDRYFGGSNNGKKS